MHVVSGIYQGSRSHCLELFSRVIAATPECDFFVIAPEPQKLADFSAYFKRPNVTLVAIPEIAAPLRLVRLLPQVARQYRLDLLHTQYIAPPFLRCATVVTVHDILFESNPEYFEKLFVLRSRLLVRRSARKSVGVFTVSEFSRGQISETFSIGPDKIRVIPNGVDCGRFFPGSDGKDIVESLGLEAGQYFLTVGRLEPRKNYANLLRAWSRLAEPRPKLVIVGQRHFGYSECLDLVRELELNRDVISLECVSDEQLPSVYRNAKAFVYCSWAEGFGMPVIEAMASGVPVISSATTALLEVCDGAALPIAPADIDEISRAVREIDRNDDLRRKLAIRGLSRAADFSWEKSADIVRNFYLEYLGVNPKLCESLS
jgi:glycosyltransferase involved in cell wall biosynthesis